ncbi:MAG: copper homeostasis protein CutC [Clostridiales bacterium]|nr:copper homeostasis protein CutC [Clostridiales bacterium]
MKKGLLECCVDSVESAIQAAKGGADRLELCAGLVIGGITPTAAMYKEIRKYTDIPIHVLLRPRFGDFCYSDHEVNMIEAEIHQFRELGAQGVVIGALLPDGTLDGRAMERFMRAAEGMSVTMHRAFDVCREPLKVLKEAKGLGIDTILTSGAEDHCVAGKELIRRLVEKAGGEIDILVAGGVNGEVIRELQPFTGATSFHMSGKVTLDSRMEYRTDRVHMGLPSLSEYEIFQTSEEKVREAKEILAELAG